MTKKYFNTGFIYAMFAMFMGAFYREFTKFVGFNGKTSLSIVHTHYFAMGMIFFFILALFENSFKFSKVKNVKFAILAYNIGLNIAGLVFIIRGIFMALEKDFSRALNASLSGIAGVGHIILVVSLAYILLSIKKVIKD